MCKVALTIAPNCAAAWAYCESVLSIIPYIPTLHYLLWLPESNLSCSSNRMSRNNYAANHRVLSTRVLQLQFAIHPPILRQT